LLFEISQTICQAKRSHSQTYLEIAKIIVEKAIKTDEETVTNWMNQELKNLTIEV